MKTTPKQINTAIQNLFSRIDYLTGGTSQESVNQAPGAIADLEHMANEIYKLVNAGNKTVIADKELMNLAIVVVAYKIEAYKFRYLKGSLPIAPDGYTQLTEMNRVVSVNIEPFKELEKAFVKTLSAKVSTNKLTKSVTFRKLKQDEVIKDYGKTFISRDNGETMSPVFYLSTYGKTQKDFAEFVSFWVIDTIK